MNNNIKFILRTTIIYILVSMFCSYIFSKSYTEFFSLDVFKSITYSEFLTFIKRLIKGLVYGGILLTIKESYVDKSYGWIRLFFVIMSLSIINIKEFSFYTLDNFYNSISVSFKIRGLIEIFIEMIIFSFIVAMPKSKDKNKKECLISALITLITLLFCNIIIYKLSHLSISYKLYKEDVVIIILSSLVVFIVTKWFYKTKNNKKYIIVILIFYLVIALVPFIYSNIFLKSSFYKGGISLFINFIPVNILILYNIVAKIS